MNMAQVNKRCSKLAGAPRIVRREMAFGILLQGERKASRILTMPYGVNFILRRNWINDYTL